MPNPNLTYADVSESAADMIQHNHCNIFYDEDHHNYLLPFKGINPEGKALLSFIHGTKIEGSNELQYRSGISDEQLLEVLIDRAEYFQAILPCEENETSLTHLRAALQAKLDRTAKRQAQEVEGTTNSHNS